MDYSIAPIDQAELVRLRRELHMYPELRWDLDRRRDFWAANVAGEYHLVARDRITVIEVWCELFMGNKKDLKANDKKEINSCIANCPGWKRADKSFYGGTTYGTQRGYIPVESKSQIYHKGF